MLFRFQMLNKYYQGNFSDKLLNIFGYFYAYMSLESMALVELAVWIASYRAVSKTIFRNLVIFEYVIIYVKFSYFACDSYHKILTRFLVC